MSSIKLPTELAELYKTIYGDNLKTYTTSLTGTELLSKIGFYPGLYTPKEIFLRELGQQIDAEPEWLDEALQLLIKVKRDKDINNLKEEVKDLYTSGDKDE